MESTNLIDDYYVVGETTILYSGFAVLINVVSKEDFAYCVTICDIPHYACLELHKNVISSFGGKKQMDVLKTYVLCISIFVQDGLRQ